MARVLSGILPVEVEICVLSCVIGAGAEMRPFIEPSSWMICDFLKSQSRIAAGFRVCEVLAKNPHSTVLWRGGFCQLPVQEA